MKETLCALMAAAVILTGGCRNRTSEISDERTPKMSVLHVIDVKQFMVSETEQYDLMIAIASIEGLLARNSEGPGVYLIESEKYDWVEEISEDAAEVKDWGGDWHGFLGELLPVIPHRYVAMDDFSIDRNSEWNRELMAVATSYAAAYDAVILPETLIGYPLFDNFEMVFDARGKTMYDVCDFFEKNPEKFCLDGIVVGASAPRCNVDLAIKKKFVMVNTRDERLMRRFYSRISKASPRFGFKGPFYEEGKDIGLAAEYGLYTIPSDNSVNISTRENTTGTDIDKAVNGRKYDSNHRKDVHYVSIVMTDGDNLCYYENKIRNDIDHPVTGRFPVTLMMTPALKQYQPALHRWYMEFLPDNWSVIMAPSGLGYTYPSYFRKDARELYAKRINSRLESEGQPYLAIMDKIRDKSEDTWEKYMGIFGDMLENMPAVEGLYFYEYGKAYTTWNGRSQYLDGIPVLSCRYSCWYPKNTPMDDPSNPRSQRKVADAVKQLPKDASSPDGYSIIMFHANVSKVTPRPVVMEDMELLVKYLEEDPGIRIVNLSEMFQIYARNVKP